MGLESKLLIKLFVMSVSTSALMACGGGSSTSPDSSICNNLTSDSFSCTNMLNSIVDNAVSPLVDELIIELTELDTAVNDFGEVIDQEQEAVKLESAQGHWREAMAIWQQLEVMQFGVIAQQRDDFYSWPLNDECKVDVDVVLAQDSEYDISTRTAPRRGLDALEYLLFDSASDSDNGKLYVRCQTVGAGKITDIPGLLEWDGLTLAEQKNQRNHYSKKISEYLITQANILKKNVADTLFDSSGDTTQDSANSISDALFYIDKKTKDAKSNNALPANSGGSFNTGHLESQYAKVSLSNIHNNLVGAKKLFSANGGIGFDDFLLAAGEEELAIRMLATLDTAIEASSSTKISASMFSIIDAATIGADETIDQRSDCINADADSVSLLEKVCALGTPVIKDFTDDLKGQFVLTLSFTVPSDAEGDND